jgi:hypothetical protein
MLTAFQVPHIGTAGDNGKKWQWFLSGSNDAETGLKQVRPRAGGLTGFRGSSMTVTSSSTCRRASRLRRGSPSAPEPNFFGLQRIRKAQPYRRRPSGAQWAAWSQLAQMQQADASRLQWDDPRVLRCRYQHDAPGRPGFHEQVRSDEERDRKRRHQRRTCELITNAHLGLFRIRSWQTTRERPSGSYCREKAAMAKFRFGSLAGQISLTPATRQAPPAAHAP